MITALQPGQRVRVILTGESGTVQTVPDDGLVTVLLDEPEIAIPVLAEQLEVLEGAAPSDSGREQKGVFLALVPVLGKEGDVVKWDVRLVNATETGCLFQVRWCGEENAVEEFRGQLEGHENARLHELRWDDLNGNPRLEVMCWPRTSAGSGKKRERSLRVRPGMLTRKEVFVPQLGCRAILTDLFQNLHGETPAPQGEGLQEYTRRNAKKAKSHATGWVSARNPMARAGFETELDLHIERLSPKPAKLTGGETLQLQLRTFDAWLDRAITLGVPSLFVIHGLGTGRLRQEIFSRLDANPHISGYQNEFHHKYGFGATEIFLD
jgi:hypothetical protein